MESTQYNRNLGLTKLTSELKNLNSVKTRYTKVISKTKEHYDVLQKQLTSLSYIITDQEKSFITINNLINDQKNISDDKLVFLKVISNTIKSGMNIVGVDTPEKM